MQKIKITLRESEGCSKVFNGQKRAIQGCTNNSLANTSKIFAPKLHKGHGNNLEPLLTVQRAMTLAIRS